MKKVQSQLLIGLCCFGLLAGQEPAQLSEESIRVDVNLVTLRFTVQSRGRSLINTLRKEDFRVFENGNEQEVVFFEPPANTSGQKSRLRLAFLIDMSGSTLATRAEEIISAQTFLENIHEFTEVGIFGFTDELIPLQNFTSNRDLALRALSRARRHLGRTAIYDSLNTLISRLSALPAKDTGKNAVIVISDGMDDAYRKSAQTITLARQNGVVIYTILVPSAAQLYIGPSMDRYPGVADRENRREAKTRAFADLSLRTGGKHFSGFEAILGFDEVMAQISDDVFGNLYTLGYYTDDPYREKAARNIRVEINHPTAYIPARFENLPDRLAAKRNFIAALFDNEAISQIPENLHTNFHEIGADMDLLSPRRQGGEIGLPFRIKISPYGLLSSEEKSIRTQFGIIGLLLDAEGNEVVRLREIFRVELAAMDIREGRGIIYTNKLFAPPGTYDLKIALVEIPTWKMTAFEDVVRITER